MQCKNINNKITEGNHEKTMFIRRISMRSCNSMVWQQFLLTKPLPKELQQEILNTCFNIKQKILPKRLMRLKMQACCMGYSLINFLITS